ncbi:hypothetical protein CBOM_00024 [Ceraceosorus bombacis]|uniref:Uncharacterized protein n=1 Tax=Ceraceosorus bombacis TaxID=401625 RepID=A0A0N7L8Q8_9BASI|nr:hypothetical protein CBOM_00024 [Ceraceosorus bombacis]
MRALPNATSGAPRQKKGQAQLPLTQEALHAPPSICVVRIAHDASQRVTARCILPELGILVPTIDGLRDRAIRIKRAWADGSS